MAYLFDILDKYQIRNLKARCDAVLTPFDLLPLLPSEIILIIFDYIEICDLRGFLLVSKAWNRRLCSPSVLHAAVLRSHPREQSELANSSCANLLRRIQRIDNFRRGDWTYQRAASEEYDPVPYSELSDRQMQDVISYSWPKLASIQTLGSEESINLATFTKHDRFRTEIYYGDDRESFYHVKCSPTLLIAISIMSKCYVWDHVKNKPVHIFKIEPGVIAATDVSDNAVVILQQHPLRVTTWSMKTRKVRQFQIPSADEEEYQCHELLIEPANTTFIHFVRNPSSCFAVRFSLTGLSIAYSIWDHCPQQDDEDNISFSQNNTVQRQPKDKYIVWSIIDHEDWAEHSALYLIKFDPTAFQFSLKFVDLGCRSVHLHSCMILYDRIQMIYCPRIDREEIEWVLEWIDFEGRTIGEVEELSGDWHLLFGDERLLLHKSNKSFRLRWFDGLSLEKTESKPIAS